MEHALPDGLSAGGEKLWRSVTDEFELGEHELSILLEAARTVDALEALEEIVRQEGVTNVSPQGVRAHPALWRLGSSASRWQSWLPLCGSRLSRKSPHPELSAGQACAIFGSPMRRRQRAPAGPTGNPAIPQALLDFVREDWPGKSEHQRWVSWAEARYSWADANLPDGYEDMPSWDGIVPDQPWHEARLEI